jgi:hypothetical protein
MRQRRSPALRTRQLAARWTARSMVSGPSAQLFQSSRQPLWPNWRLADPVRRQLGGSAGGRKFAPAVGKFAEISGNSSPRPENSRISTARPRTVSQPHSPSSRRPRPRPAHLPLVPRFAAGDSHGPMARRSGAALVAALGASREDLGHFPPAVAREAAWRMIAPMRTAAARGGAGFEGRTDVLGRA